MGTITAIQPQRRSGRYNVMVDGAFAIAVSEKVLVDLRLTIGQELDEAKLTLAATAEDSRRALNNALRLLESRARSESEIFSRLKQQGYSAQTVQGVLDKLKGYGFVDDAQFTTSWIESRSRSQPGGRYKLKSELAFKGVAKETIDRAIGEITEEDELSLARKALLKRSATIPDGRDERRAAYIRDAGYLARRGFGWSIAKPVLQERYGAVSDEADD